MEITTNDLFGKTNKIIDKINELIDEVNKLKDIEGQKRLYKNRGRKNGK